MDELSATSSPDQGALSSLAARVLGCLIEKEFATPDIYPLTLNALINACNQKSNRDPAMEVAARELEAALDELRQARMAVVFAGADSRVPKYKHKLDGVHPMEPAARALLAELLLRGPQTTAGLRGNAERLHPMPALEAVEALLNDLAGRPSGPIVRKLPRQPGQKEARWVQLLTGEPMDEPSLTPAPVSVKMTLPTEVDLRLKALELEVKTLRSELAVLRNSLGG